MFRVLFSLCALALALQVSSQVVQPEFTMDDTPQLPSIPHPTHVAHMFEQHLQQMPPQMIDDQQQHQQYHFEPQHLQMHAADQHDQQLGSPLLGLDPFAFQKMKLKFHPLNPFNPLRIPGAGFSNIQAGHFGGLHFGNALLGSGNPMEEEQHFWGADDQHLAARQPAEYNYHVQEQSPQHYQLQAPLPAEYNYHLQAPQPAEYHLQAPSMPQHYQLQAPQPSEHHLQAPQMPQLYQLQAPQLAENNYHLEAPQQAEYQVQAPMMIEQVPFPQRPAIPESHQIEASNAEDGSRHWKGWDKWGDKKG
jgi:hypothetical protein